MCADYGRTYGGMCVAWMGGTPAVVLFDRTGRRVDLLVQVDLAGEATKHGATPT